MRLHNKGSKTKGAYQDRFLIVDEDRAVSGDWSIVKLQGEAAKHEITVCVQRPNHEGLLFRMKPGREREIPSADKAETKLKIDWPSYKKPETALTLGRRFSLEDLLRVAKVEADLKFLLERIGLMPRA